MFPLVYWIRQRKSVPLSGVKTKFEEVIAYVNAYYLQEYGIRIQAQQKRKVFFIIPVLRLLLSKKIRMQIFSENHLNPVMLVFI